ncbi:YicC family protein [Microbulbifer bruguierae]|uniref:YicC family protein n=1 Tax=Microbulbifer bruguierae TaxID=3029061 RepID=A0ABY8NBL9_9GAMM|nr:YicC/YloC family endoribonuclease [Microbulbifer bruguierae]WGL15472.1 YicC family protein [Microbulbifer bruguierae]
MANNKVRSMTAFGRAEVNYSTGTAIWEMRSVNHRYLEPHFRLPEAARALEPKLRETLRKTLNRGKVEMTLTLKPNVGEASRLQVNQPLVEELIKAANLVVPAADSLSLNPLEILKWPGVIAEPATDTNEQSNAIFESFNQALQQVLENREREGAELAGFIEARIKSIGEQVTEVRALLPQILENQREKLRTRLQELLTEIDRDRIEQEIALLAQKADVDEELDRLDAHITETRRVLKNGGAIGRRLDFLMQEFNREANTLSSKSVVTDTTQAAVELKVLIEQMREQVQNIE